MAGTHMWIASAVVTLGRRSLSPLLMKPSKINTCLENKQTTKKWFCSNSHLSPQDHF